MKNKIKSLLKNKNNKTLLENFASLSFLQIVNILLPLITLPYVLRVLGTSNYGLVVLASSVVTYFHSITDYSFKITATRDVALSRSSPIKLNYIYSKVMNIKTLILMFSLLILTGIVFLYDPFYEERLTFFLTFPMLLGHVLFPEWFFQGMEKMKYITFLNVGVKVFFTACIFIFITDREDYWIYPLLSSLGYVISGIIAQYILIKNFHLKFSFLSFRLIKITLKNNFAIFVNQFLPNLYNNSTTVMLGLIVNTSAVGIYDAIKKVVDLCVILINIISRTFFPYLNRNQNSFKKYLRLMISAGSLLTILPILFAQIIFWYLNINQENAFIILVILSTGIFFISLYDIFGVNFFVIKREDKLVMKNTFWASIVGVILSFPLIYYFGILGAAINLTMARAFMGFGLCYKYLVRIES